MGLYSKKLCIKKPNGVIQKANLYTDKADVGSKYLSLKSGSDIVYAKLDVDGDMDCLVKKNGTNFKVKRVVGYKKYRMMELYPNIYATMTSVPNDKDWYSFTEDLDDFFGADSMFRHCKKISTIPLINLSNVKTIFALVAECQSLTSIPQLDTSSVENMNWVFQNCISLTTIPLLNTSNATTMNRMFWDCTSLTTVPTFDIRSLKYWTESGTNKQRHPLENMIKDTKITHITFRNKPPHLQITPQILGKPDVIIHYV